MLHRNPEYWWDKTNYCALCLHNDGTIARLYCDSANELIDTAVILAFSTYTIKVRCMALRENKWTEVYRIG